MPDLLDAVLASVHPHLLVAPFDWDRYVSARPSPARRFSRLVTSAPAPPTQAATDGSALVARLAEFGVVADFGGEVRWGNKAAESPNRCGASVRGCVPAGAAWAGAVTAVGVRGRTVGPEELDGVSVGRQLALKPLFEIPLCFSPRLHAPWLLLPPRSRQLH